mmetsp:Transcript_44197/g.73654  ORF Transcript_44197/g.73654 Transcript_44197/m.73654 type:complete len:105 (+) Transcript_44197:1572-1886(+)
MRPYFTTKSSNKCATIPTTICSYNNRFRVVYHIKRNWTLTLPKYPPTSDSSREIIYGKTIHGWNGIAAITRREGRFVFHPKGYVPQNESNPEVSTWHDMFEIRS